MSTTGSCRSHVFPHMMGRLFLHDVLWFMLLFFSETPFATEENNTPHKILERVGEGKYSLNGPAWANVSESAKDLVKCLLHVDPSKRLSAKQILIHPWIVHRNSLPTTRLNFSSDPSKVMVSCCLFVILNYCRVRGFIFIRV